MLSVKLTNGELISEPNLDWNNLPNHPIQYMDYRIRSVIGPKIIRLRGYERYLRIKEMAHGVNVGIQINSKIFLIGCTGNNCTKITIDLIRQKCKKEQCDISQIYKTSIDEKYWKTGCPSSNPNVYINRVVTD